MSRARREASHLVLASASPRRRDLLRTVGIDAIVVPAGIDETPEPGESPSVMVERLALAKARFVASGQPDAGVVVAADTTIDLDGRSLGKPVDRADARLMLEALSGRSHTVCTGLAVVRPGGGGGAVSAASSMEQTAVTFRSLTTADIEEYLDTGEPEGKAGAYAIQGFGSLLVERIEGSYANVVGLPVVALDRLVRRLGLKLSQFRPEAVKAEP